MLVYLITNKVNGKRYVGQHAGSDLDVYWHHNAYMALNGYQGKRLLYRAIRKYGEESFEVIPLVIVNSKEEMDRYEIGLIAHLDLCNPEKGYNLTAGGGGSFGFKPDEETREKMSKSHIGLKMPESHSRALSERNKGNKYSLGRKMTESNHNKLMAVHIGSKRTEEAKKRMSDSHKGKKMSEETKQRMRESQQLRRQKENTQ
jgi:group I intron endonuclease